MVLLVAVRAQVSGMDCFFIALHAKSKAIAHGKQLWTSRDPHNMLAFVKKGIKNRFCANFHKTSCSELLF
jgi:hypothetical protein